MHASVRVFSLSWSEAKVLPVSLFFVFFSNSMVVHRLVFGLLFVPQVLSRQIAELGIYPAVDPLDSTSRMLDPRVIGDVHYETARATQKLLQDYKGLQVGRRSEIFMLGPQFQVLRRACFGCDSFAYIRGTCCRSN